MKRYKSSSTLEVVYYEVGPGAFSDESAIIESTEKLSKC